MGLNSLEDSDWEPDLDALDEVIASLTVLGLPRAGLMCQVWQLTAQSAADDTEQQVGGTPDYTVVFNRDETYSFRADCNSGGGPALPDHVW